MIFTVLARRVGKVPARRQWIALYSSPFPSLPNFIALIECSARGGRGCRGANWGGLAYVRVIRADTRGLSQREKTDNKFTEWGRRDPPYQDPCQVPAPAPAVEDRVPQTTGSDSCTSEGAGPHCAAVTHSTSLGFK